MTDTTTTGPAIRTAEKTASRADNSQLNRPPRPSAPRPAGRRRGGGWLALRTVLAVVITIVIAFPLYWMVVVAFSGRGELLGGELRLWPRTFTLANFRQVLDAYPVSQWFNNSVAIAVVTALISVAFSMLGGYALAQLRVKGANVVFLIMLSTLMIPVQVIMVSLFKIVTGLGLYGSYWAVILPTAASAFGLFLARQFMLSIPRDLIEAARIDGAGHLRTFFFIVLPLCKPLLAVLFFMTLLQSWNDFAWPLIALGQNQLFTLPVGLRYLQGQFGPNYGATMAFALINVAPMAALFLIFQRFFVQGFARSGIR